MVSVSWERGPDASRLYCKTGNTSVRPPPFVLDGDGFQQCGGATVVGVVRRTDLRQDARRSPDGWPDDVARLQFESARTQTSLERTLGVRPAFDSAPGVFLRKSAGGR